MIKFLLSLILNISMVLFLMNFRWFLRLIKIIFLIILCFFKFIFVFIRNIIINLLLRWFFLLIKLLLFFLLIWKSNKELHIIFVVQTRVYRICEKRYFGHIVLISLSYKTYKKLNKRVSLSFSIDSLNSCTLKFK